MADLHGAEPLRFDEATASALIAELRSSAAAIEGQIGARSSSVTSGSESFAGRFADLFGQNARIASADAAEIAVRLREVSGWVRQLASAAERENARRRRAREWQDEQEHRNLLDHVHDFFTGGEQPPVESAEKPPVFRPAEMPVGVRQTPVAGSGGGGGRSSARPESLRGFAATSAVLDSELSRRPGALRGRLADFASRCRFGRIDATGLVVGFDRWLAANAEDGRWARVVADAFAAAGGEGAVSTVADSALAAALLAAGIDANRADLVIDPPRAYGAQPTSGYSMDPVNTSTGNFLEPETDLAFGGGSASLVVSRMYNSLDGRVGVFGVGWASILETSLEVDDEGASYRQADGRVVCFPRSGAGWERATGENFWLATEPDPAFSGVGEAGAVLVVRDNAGAWWSFTRSGVWLGSGVGEGTGVAVERDVDGRVARLVHARGRFVDVEYAGGRVAALRASDGRGAEYGYDGQGRLVTVRSEAGTRSYGWNAAGLIETVTSASGVVEATNEYDEGGRVTMQVSPHGRRVRFAYLPGRVTVVSDEDGSRSNTWITDARGRLVGVVDADDHRQSMSYDAEGNLVSATERDGATTVHAYDVRGRRIRTVTPSGGDVTYGYDDADRVTTVVTESGAEVTFAYTGDDRDPSTIVDPEGGRTRLLWHAGLLLEVVDPAGVLVRCGYDQHGDLISTTNAAGDTARIDRDSQGRPVSAVSPSGARTTYGYDQAGMLVARRDPDGALWRFENDVGGRVSAIVDPLGARTTFDYGAHGEVTRVVDALGRAETRVFDDQGSLRSVSLPGGGEWGFLHDALSRLRAVTDPTGARWGFEYDPSGELTAVVDPTGVRKESVADQRTGVATLRSAFETATVRFDEFGRPTEVSSPAGGSELTVYDRCGRPIELVDGEGGLTRIDRDEAGRVVAITTPSGACTRYEYDSCGRPSATVDPLGARTEVRYDPDSRVICRTLPTGEVHRIGYDQMGRVLSYAISGEGTARYGYDKVGRLTRSQDSRYGSRRFRYDAAGQLVEAVTGLGGVTRYDYDERGRVTTITDPLGGVTRRAYDGADRVISDTDPLGRTTTADYDLSGRMTLRRDPEGCATTWSYDAEGRPSALQVDGRLCSSISRNARERRVVVTDHTRSDGVAVEHEVQFDRRGLLTRRSRGDEAIHWEYDADGAPIARVDPDGTRTRYQLDAAGHPVTVEGAGLAVATFGYDGVGRLVCAATGDTVQSWSYVDGALTAHTSTDPGGTTTTRIDRDEAGRITAITGPRGRVTYDHDEAGQLIRLEAGAGRATSWKYDLAGRLVSESVDGIEKRYAYDTAGQLLSSVDTGSGERLEYVHDGLGRRIRRIASDGSTTDYAWADLGHLAGITTRDGSGHVITETTVWVDALGELADIDGATTWWDTASSVPLLVSIGDTSVLPLPGGITGIGTTWTYSGWRGTRRSDDADPWALAQSTDAGLVPAGVSLTGGALGVSGLEWLGARAYDPTARGFLSTDPWEGVVGAGWSGNPYSFAGNDPLHAVDPWGLRPATDADLRVYRDGHQGAVADVRDFADRHSQTIASIAIGVGIGVGVAAMIITLGPVALIVGGALLAGGISILQNKGDDGRVDWGRVGVDALIGGASVAAGGFAAAGLSKLAPVAGRIAAPGIQGIVPRVFDSAGRQALSAGISGAVSDTASYGTSANVHNKDAAGYAMAALTGFGVGVGASIGAGKLSGTAMGWNPMQPQASAVAGRHALAPNLAHVNSAIESVVNSAAGGVGGVVNEWFRPGVDRERVDLLAEFGKGALNGAHGPNAAQHGGH